MPAARIRGWTVGLVLAVGCAIASLATVRHYATLHATSREAVVIHTGVHGVVNATFADVSRIRPGQQATVTLLADPTAASRAKVESIDTEGSVRLVFEGMPPAEGAARVTVDTSLIP